MLGSVSIQSALADTKSYQVVANKEQENKSDKLSAFELKLKKIRTIKDPYKKSLALINLGSEMDRAGIAKYKAGKVFKEAFDVALTIESDSVKASVLSKLGSELDERGFYKRQVSKVFLAALEALNGAQSFAEYRYHRHRAYTDRIGSLLCKMAKAGLYRKALFYTAIITDPLCSEGVIGWIVTEMAMKGLTISQIRGMMHKAGLPESAIRKALKEEK